MKSNVASNRHANGSPSATLFDYQNFHGMLCNPWRASRCIHSFNGMILFMPSSYTPRDLTTYDYSTKGMLTPLSYNLLVMFSFTGLSTLLKMTSMRLAIEIDDNAVQQQNESQVSDLTSKYNSNLRIEPEVLDYCKRYTLSSSMKLKRWFEYRFALCGGLEVIMLHFVCDQNKLHLVEVYDFENWIWRKWVTSFVINISNVFRIVVASSKAK